MLRKSGARVGQTGGGGVKEALDAGILVRLTLQCNWWRLKKTTFLRPRSIIAFLRGVVEADFCMRAGPGQRVCGPASHVPENCPAEQLEHELAPALENCPALREVRGAVDG